jgi:hypothetical protein
MIDSPEAGSSSSNSDRYRDPIGALLVAYLLATVMLLLAADIFYTGAEPPPRCDPEDCGPGETCGPRGQCVQRPSAPICEPDAPCDACTCMGECDQELICRERKDPSVANCASPENRRTIRSLIDFEKQCNDRTGGILACTHTEFGKLLAERPEVQSLLLNFPRAITLLLPNGRPDAATREHYVSKLAEHREALLGAYKVFILISGPDGGFEGGLDIDQRLRDAHELLLASVVSSKEKAALSDRLVLIPHVTTDLPDLRAFYRWYGRAMIGPTDDLVVRYQEVLQQYVALHGKKDAAVVEVQAAIARASLIVALPPECAPKE